MQGRASLDACTRLEARLHWIDTGGLAVETTGVLLAIGLANELDWVTVATFGCSFISIVTTLRQLAADGADDLERLSSATGIVRSAVLRLMHLLPKLRI